MGATGALAKQHPLLLGSREEEGGQRKGHAVPVNRGNTSRGVHVRALADALLVLIENLPDVPSEKRVRLRTHLAALRRAYPSELQVSEVDLAHYMEDPDDATI